MKISIFGTGYVGLVTGACFAELGNHVLCSDINLEKIQKLKNSEIPFFEPGLQEIVLRNIKEQRLFFTTDPKETVKWGEVLFIAVGTPPKQNGEADLSHIIAVAKTIGQNLENNNVVVVTKSTIPVGITLEVDKIISEELKTRDKNIKFSTVNNPEFLRQGQAVQDFMLPERVVVGVKDDWARRIMENLYLPQTKNGHPLLFMDIASSEMAKYAANTFIAARISLINEISQICNLVGADIENIRKAIGSDSRIGPKYLYPGVGYGGSCFPKDVQALAFFAEQKGYAAQMINAIEKVNQNQKEFFAKAITSNLKNLENKKIAIWGLSFKPNTDDLRSAPSIFIIDYLSKLGAEITAYDPVAMAEAKKILPKEVKFSEGMYEALKEADCLVLITEWSQFKEPDFIKIKSLLKTPIIFDGRNIYSPEKMKELGFTYVSIGRKNIDPNA